MEVDGGYIIPVEFAKEVRSAAAKYNWYEKRRQIRLLIRLLRRIGHK